MNMNDELISEYGVIVECAVGSWAIRYIDLVYMDANEA